MSKIWDMLKKEKIEWKRLGEVCGTVTDYVAAGSFKSNSKNVIYLNSPDYAQLVRTKDIKSNFNNKEIFVYVDKKAFDYLYRVNLDEECLVLPNIGNCGEIYHILPEKLPYKNNVLGPNAILLKSRTENMKFLYYLFCSKNFQKNLYKITSKIGQGKFNKTDLKEIKIPIPSLKTQEKIVNILDKFTECTTNLYRELNKELELRIQQYEYYRSMLLSEDYLKKKYKLSELRHTTLGEVGDIQMCKRILKNQTSECGDIPFYKIGTFGKQADAFISRQLFEEYKNKYNYPKTGEVLISASGTIGRTVIFNGEDAYFQDSNIVWISHSEEIVLNKYLYYLYQIINWNTESGGTISRLYTYNLKNMKIALPPIEVQEKIVNILDKFHTIVHDLKIGLPREIELRQKHYEYYRDKLLAFEKVD